MMPFLLWILFFSFPLPIMVQTATPQEFEAPALECIGVTVYTDRAEVKRAIKLTLEEGKNEIVVKKLPEVVDQDSIRVEGTGNAVISEVQFQTKHIDTTGDEEVNKSKRNELKEQLQKLNDKNEQMSTGLRRLNRKREILDGIALQISSGKPGGSDKENIHPALSPASLDDLDKYLTHYETRVEAVDKDIFENQQNTKNIQKEIDLTNRNLREIGGGRDIEISREVSVILEGKKSGGEAELILSYVVENCGWVPSYDVRVFAEEKTMKIQYYGQVTQNTGEDWKETQLFLSTATPNIGGQVPELNTMKVSFVPVREPKKARPGQRKIKCKETVAESSEEDDDEMEEEAFMAEMSYASNEALHTMRAAYDYVPAMATLEAYAKESVVSTNFEIARATTIPSDGTDHKVNVAVIDLIPEFQYVTVPRKTAYAYLKAKVINKSAYPLLPGNVAVFLDNNFVAKSSLKSVSPMEEFSVSLGVDPAIRVDYKPVHKFQEETGMFTKSSIVTYVQKIDIKNTRQENIDLLLIDHIPLSTDEKIKINLIEPALPRSKNEKSAVSLNKDNNLEWSMSIKEGQEMSYEIKYSIETPKGNELEFNEMKGANRGASFSSY